MPDIHSLTDDQLPIVYAMAVYDAPLIQNRLLEIFKLRAQQTSDGTPYEAAELKKNLEKLSRDFVIMHEIGLGYTLRHDFKMQVLLKLQQIQLLKSWVTSVREFIKSTGEYNQWRHHDQSFYCREILFSAFRETPDDLMLWREKLMMFPVFGLDFPAAHFFYDDAGISLFSTLPLEIQTRLLSDFLSSANWYLMDCQAAYVYASANVEKLTEESPELLDILCWQALLRGEIADMYRFQSQLPVQFQNQALLALALVKGEIPFAAQMAHTILKEVRTQFGKRKIFIPELIGYLLTVALLASNQEADLKRAKEQVDEALKYHSAIPRGHAYQLMQGLVNHLALGVPLLELNLLPCPNRDIDALFMGLSLYWQDAKALPQVARELTHLRDSCAKTGYTWLAAELDQILLTHYQIAPVLPEWHQEQQLKPLIQAFQREETWQRALKALSQLKPNATPAQAGQDTRVAWLLDFPLKHIKIDPREQKKSAKGVWSKGRAIALKRLAQEQDSLPCMSEQDKRIADCIRKTFENYYGGSEFELQGDKALPLLVGHPAVYWFDAPDIRIDIVKGDPCLQMHEKTGQISLQLEPHIGPNDSVVWHKETPTRVAVYAVTPEIRQIASILGSGLSVPSNAKAQLIDVISAIAPHLAIHSDLPELSAHIHSIPADSCLYAHLLPLKEGLRVQFLVRPLKEGGWFPPGKGASNVVGELDGAPIQAARQLSEERKKLLQITQACPALLEDPGHDDNVLQQNQYSQEWQLEHPEACLELLTQLKAIGEDDLQLVWPEGERFRLKGNRSLGQMRLTIKKQGEWFVAGGEITLDDGRVLALRELLQLSEHSTGRFLKLGDDDYLALTDNFRKRLDELRMLGEVSGKDGIRINPLAAAALAELAGEVDDLQADSAWREQVAKLDALADFQPQLPSTLQAELRDYQLEGYQWLARLAQWGVGACLADDMGLGKTIQTLALLLDRAPNGPALVVAPISVALNWQSEVARFAPTLQVRAYHSNRSLTDLGAFDIVIVSYGMLQSDIEFFSAQHWHTAVLDEAQVIKNAATKRSQAAMALTADFKMIASGTPVENHLGELWNLFRFINPGLLGSKERFAERFANPIEKGDPNAKLHLKKLLQPFILRRTKTQVLKELPSRTEITLQVELSDEERHLYEALRQEAIEKIAQIKEGEGRSMQVLAEITKLRRFCCNPKLVLKNSNVEASKLAVFAETLEELLDNKHKALVFSQFVDHLAIVRSYLEEKGISYQYLDGSTPALERKKRVDAFQAGLGDVFLISLKAGGTGLNLTAADYVIHLDPWWNPAVEDQASDRAHRMGQLRPVTIYRLVAQETIEQKILALHAQKRDLADSLLEGGDAAGKMNTAALLKLLKDNQ